MNVSVKHLVSLLNVAELYMRCLNEDPENEALTLPEAMLTTDLRDAIKHVRHDVLFNKGTDGIPDYIGLYGNEDCDVSAWCKHCNPNGGHFAEYGHGLEFEAVNGFFNAILEHCKTHE